VPKLRELFGDKVKLRHFGQRRGLLSRFGVMDAALGSLEERALWARYGLSR
jgi:serine protease SohB